LLKVVEFNLNIIIPKDERLIPSFDIRTLIVFEDSLTATAVNPKKRTK